MFTLKIVTPEKVVLEEAVLWVTLPIEGGEVTVLPNHIPYIGAVKPGEIVIGHEGEEERSLATSGGFVEFHGGVLTMLADTAEHAESIHLERAQAARDRAEMLKSQVNTEDAEAVARTARLLEKEMARIKVATKHRTRNLPNISSR
ncbi:MAG: ATP synthase F1 subunit epsilon [Candidatus Moraniibacteriota bacterium]